MLTDAFPKLNRSRFVAALRDFYHSGSYIALLVILMLFAQLFSMELLVWWMYLALGALALLVDEDTIAVAPIFCCGYMSVSGANNPGRYEDTIFTRPECVLQLAIILVIGVIFIMGRLLSKQLTSPRRDRPALLFGFVALGFAYLLGGAFTPYYGTRTLLFGFVQIVSLALIYFFFRATVNWDRLSKEYGLKLFFALGLGLVVEVVGMYFQPWVDLKNFSRGMLYTGWGIYNNVGAALALCIPAAFYFSAVRRNGWVYTFFASVMLLGVFLSQSRGSILFGVAVYILSAIFALVCAKKGERVKQGVVYLFLLLALVAACAAFREQFLALFRSVIEAGLASSGREKIYAACWKTFLSHPIFGVGFYETPGALLNDGGILDLAPCPPDVFLPPRAHNTFMQLIASGGAVALLAYLFHRVQTLRLFFCKPTKQKTFLGLCILALLLTSLLDCHFFNIGPGFLYSFLLVFAEGGELGRDRLARRRLGA